MARVKKSHFYFSEPKTEILGAPELFINRGSTINLTCVVLQSPEPPAYIFWNHNDAVSPILPYPIRYYSHFCSGRIATRKLTPGKHNGELKHAKFTRNE
ncbi:hypothetical protein P5V15_012059 [Pogonomyrmex californicus]